MTLSLRQIFGLVIAGSVGSMALLAGTSGVNAASVTTTGTASVTVSTSGGVSTPDPEPEVPATNNTQVPVVTSGSSSGSSITVTPSNPLSNLGFAPVNGRTGGGGGTAEASGAGSSSSSTTNGSGTPVQPRFSNPNVSTTGLGAASGVSVAGAPNQTFSFVLPDLTVYASLGQMVTLSNFQHTGGTTPFVGNDGAGFFSIGAQINQSPISAQLRGRGQDDNDNAEQQFPANLQTITSSLSDAALIGGDLPSVLASAFTYRSPYVNIVVSYY